MAKNGGKVTTREFYDRQLKTDKTISDNHIELKTLLSGLVPIVEENSKKIAKVESRKDRIWNLINSVAVGIAVLLSRE